MDVSFGLGIKQAGFDVLLDHVASTRREQIDLAQKGQIFFFRSRVARQPFLPRLR